MRKWEKVKYEADIAIFGLGALVVVVAGIAQGFRASEVVVAACFLALTLVKAFTYVAREKQMGGKGRKPKPIKEGIEKKGGVNEKPEAMPAPLFEKREGSDTSPAQPEKI
jgi:hypothetical protein